MRRLSSLYIKHTDSHPVRHTPEKTHTACSHIAASCFCSARVLVFVYVQLCEFTHVSEVEKHNSPLHQKQAVGGVNQTQRHTWCSLHLPDKHTTVYNLLQTPMEKLTNTFTNKDIPPTPLGNECSYSIQLAQLKLLVEFPKAKLKIIVHCCESMQNQKGKGLGFTTCLSGTLLLGTDCTNIKANFLSLVLCVFCSE